MWLAALSRWIEVFLLIDREQGKSINDCFIDLSQYNAQYALTAFLHDRRMWVDQRYEDIESPLQQSGQHAAAAGFVNWKNEAL
jgi:hypothetical protein